MSQEKPYSSIEPLVLAFMEGVIGNYLAPLMAYVQKNSELIKTAPGFLINPEEIVIYVGRTHIAIEYIGSEISAEVKKDSLYKMRIHDCSVSECNIFEKIIGFEYDSNSSSMFSLPLPLFSEDLGNLRTSFQMC